MKINKSAIRGGEGNLFEGEEISLKEPLPYPLHKISKIKYEARFYKVKERLLGDVKIKTNLEVEDTSDCTPFIYSLNIEEKGIEIMDKEDGESEGYIFPSSSFELDDLLFNIILSHLPIRLTKDLGKIL